MYSPKARYVLAFLGFWGCFNIFSLRLNLSVAIVDMVIPGDKNYELNSEDKQNRDERKTNGNLTEGKWDEKQGKFTWDEITQGIVLGCYFYGHGIFHLPGGRISELYSPKILYGSSMLATALLSLISPIAARWHIGAFIAVRALQGILSGIAWPVLHTLLARWFPKDERAFLSSFVYTGRLMGAAATMEFSGLMIYAEIMGGWPSVFYIFGIVGVIWFVFWMIFVHDLPEKHPRITREELTYIQNNTDGQKSEATLAIPWRQILTSAPVWALCVSHFGNSYGLETLMLLLPTYMKTILGYNIRENGHLSALPFLVDALAGFVAAYVADYVLRKGYMGVTAIRKSWCAFAYLGAAACFIGVAFAGDDAIIAVVLFLFALGFSGVAAPSVFVVQIDMAPDFAGTLMGLSSFFGSLAGIVAPFIVGVLTENQPTLERWRIAFIIIVVVYVITTIVFLVFGSAELQPWGVCGAIPKTETLSREKSIRNNNSHEEKTPLLKKSST